MGTGRSGSTALSRILNAHPDVLSLNEFMASVGPRRLPRREGDRRGVPAVAVPARPSLRADDPQRAAAAGIAAVVPWPERTAAEHHQALFGLLRARFGRTAVVERSGYSTGWAAGLRATFPHARFVHMFRDGPDCALSMSRHPGHRTISLLREIKARAGIDSLADLTDEHVRSLPAGLSPLLEERFDPALVRDRDLPPAHVRQPVVRLVTDGTEFIGRLPVGRRTTLAHEDFSTVLPKSSPAWPSSSASTPTRSGCGPRPHSSTTADAAPPGGCRPLSSTN
ncbi:sulfotransferase [Streptomyces sp. NRRL B-2790]